MNYDLKERANELYTDLILDLLLLHFVIFSCEARR